jgi:hypothetical protein
MKTLSALALSIALLASGAAFAADAPTDSAHSTKACAKEAKAKSLKGEARTKFIKECKAGKSQ